MLRYTLVASLVFLAHSASAQPPAEPAPTPEAAPATAPADITAPAATAPDAVVGEVAPSAAAAAEQPAPATAATNAPEGSTGQGHEHADCGCGAQGHAAQKHGFAIAFDGYLRAEATTMIPDRFFGILMPSSTKRDSEPAVGRSDGFALADARLNLRATYRDNLYVRIGFDGAIAAYANADDPIGVLSTGVKDAYLRYTFFPALTLYAGRFKPPYDVEELTPTESQFFVHRALESRGVRRHEGGHADLFGKVDNAGFAPGRQIGVMIGSDKALDLGGSAFGYAVAVTNGNGGDAAQNDNDLPAVWLRLFNTWQAREEALDDEEGPATYDLRGGGMAGLSFFYNELTTGLAPSRYRDRVLGAGLDVAATLWVFHLQGQLLAAMLEPVSRVDTPTVFSLGGHAQLAIQIPGTGFYPAYRFALLDPRYVSDDELDSPDQDRVMHHTVGVAYRAQELPIVWNLEYSRSLEQGGRAQPNDRVEAALEVTFQ